MTDTLNNFCDDELTDEEHEALIAISEHAVAPPLSPAASAVLKAANKYATQAWSGATYERYIHGVTAALRTAAEQIEDLYCENLVIDDSDGIVFGLRQLMIIADELESL
jgi:hypothetical protein